MIATIVETCKDPVMVIIINIIQKIMGLFQIIVPIIAIIAMVKIFTQLVVSPDNKKLKTAIRNWLIALLVFFFLPTIVNVTMNLLEEEFGFNFAKCWNYAKESNVSIGNGDNNDEDFENNRKVIWDKD